MSEDRRAVLEAIAYGEGSSPTERLKAMEMLDRLALGVDDRFTFNFAGLEGEALDRELEGYFHPGWQPGDPNDPLTNMPERWQRRVEREVRSRVKRLAVQLDERVQVAAKALVAKDRQTDEKPPQQEPANVVPLRPERELRHDERPLMSPAEAERERQMAAAHVRDHTPPGISPEALRVQWPSYRKR